MQNSTQLPKVGLGLRAPHYQDWLNAKADSSWCEAISENYMYTKGPPRERLRAIRASRPLALHGVSMSIGSQRAGRETYLKVLAELISELDPWIVSDHFCWTGLGAHNSFDLLPLSFTQHSITELVEHIDEAQNLLKRRLYFENISAYIGFKDSSMTEAAFLSEVLKKSGCGLLLDLNNIYVNAINFGFHAAAYLEHFKAEDIGQIHLAGHSQVNDFLYDTHAGPVIDEVWQLYRLALELYGPVPTLIEWDEEIPSFHELKVEQKKAETLWSEVLNVPS